MSNNDLDGVEEFDPNIIKFGRTVWHDPMSRQYGIDVAGVRFKSVEWRRFGGVLNQGGVGAYTGFAMTGCLQCLAGSIKRAKEYDHDYAMKLYSDATFIDQFPGHYPPDDTGSSGLAVAKAARRLGDIRSYRWAFSTSGLLAALRSGPVIVGTVWTDGMMSVDENGFVRPSGSVRGGHEWLIRGCNLSHNYLIADNSWGTGWCKRGSFFISIDDWEVLRRREADVTIPLV